MDNTKNTSQPAVPANIKEMLLQASRAMPKPLQAEMLNSLGITTVIYTRGDLFCPDGTVFNDDDIHAFFESYIKNTPESELAIRFVLEPVYIGYAKDLILEGVAPEDCPIPDAALTVLARIPESDESDFDDVLDIAVQAECAKYTQAPIVSYQMYIEHYSPNNGND